MSSSVPAIRSLKRGEASRTLLLRHEQRSRCIGERGGKSALLSRRSRMRALGVKQVQSARNPTLARLPRLAGGARGTGDVLKTARRGILRPRLDAGHVERGVEPRRALPQRHGAEHARDAGDDLFSPAGDVVGFKARQRGYLAELGVKITRPPSAPCRLRLASTAAASSNTVAFRRYPASRWARRWPPERWSSRGLWRGSRRRAEPTPVPRPRDQGGLALSGRSEIRA